MQPHISIHRPVRLPLPILLGLIALLMALLAACAPDNPGATPTPQQAPASIVIAPTREATAAPTAAGITIAPTREPVAPVLAAQPANSAPSAAPSASNAAVAPTATTTSLMCSEMHRLQLEAFGDRLEAIASQNGTGKFDPATIKAALQAAGVTGSFELVTTGTVVVYENGLVAGIGVSPATNLALPQPMILGTPDAMSADAEVLIDLGNGSKLYRGGTLPRGGGVIWISSYSWPEFHSGECQ